MASIDHPRGKPRVRWCDPDGTPHARTCSTEKAAREILRAVQHAEDVGRKWVDEGTPQTLTLRAVARAWITACERRLAPRTVTNRAQHLDAFIAWYGKDAEPGLLSRLLLERYWDFVRTVATGRYIHRRTETTARKHIETIHLLWTWAYGREEYEPHVPRPRLMELPRKPAKTPRAAPTWAQMDAAISACGSWRRCALIVMRCTGLRVQQVMGLRWEDLDTATGLLTIRGELGKPGSERTGRIVPVAPALLAEWRAPGLAEWTDKAWIVPCPHTHRLMRARDVALVWTHAGVTASTWKGRPDHAFRAGFQTELAAMGIAREAREYLVGHAQPGQDVSYIEAIRGLQLVSVVAKVPALAVARIERSETA